MVTLVGIRNHNLGKFGEWDNIEILEFENLNQAQLYASREDFNVFFLKFVRMGKK